MDKHIIVWRGNLISPGKLKRVGRFLTLPGIIWVMIFCIVPTILLLGVSFASRSATGGIEWSFTFDNFKLLAGFGSFGWSATNGIILLRSFGIGLATTVLCAILAYPLAFFIASRTPRSRPFWLILLTVPFWTNLIVRTYAWLILLGPGSPITKIAELMGFVEPGAALYPSTFATLMGMITAFLPFMVMPIYAAVEKLNWSIVEASQDLYASRISIFRNGILPQTVSGLSVGVILTFIPAMGMFLVSDLLGGAKFMLIGNLIQLQFGFGSGNPPYAAALSFLLILLTLGIIAVFLRLGGKKDSLV